MNRQVSGQRHRRLTADRAGRGRCHRGYGLSCSRKASAPSSCDVRRPYPPHTKISIASLQLSMLDIRLCRGPGDRGPGPTTQLPNDEDNRTPFCPGPRWRLRQKRPATPTQTQNGVDVEPYADLVADLVKSKNDYVSGLETRAVAVITTSGALVTLVLARAGLVTRSQTFQVPDAVLNLAIVAVVLFVLASLAAMWVNRPRKVWDVDSDELEVQMWDRWTLSHPHDPLRKATATHFELWRAGRKLSADKAWALVVAVAAQATAVVVLGVAAVLVLLDQP